MGIVPFTTTNMSLGALFGELGTLADYLNLTPTWNFGMAWLNSVVLGDWFNSTQTPVYMVYWGILSMLVMAWASAGFVAVHTINNAVLNLYIQGATGANPWGDILGYYFTY